MKYQRRHTHPIKKCRGVGLLEVLVAMVVVSFGVLGLAGMQLTGMKHSAGGYTRSKAVLFAEDMVARMRLNPVGVNAGAYDDFDSNSDVNCAVMPTTYCQTYPTSTTAKVNGLACNATQMAAFDMFSASCGSRFSNNADNGLIDELGGGQMEITCDDTPCTVDSYYTVVVRWNETSSADNDETTQDAKRVQIRFNP